MRVAARYVAVAFVQSRLLGFLHGSDMCIRQLYFMQLWVCALGAVRVAAPQQPGSRSAAAFPISSE